MERNWKSFACGSFLAAALALGLCSSALATGTPELELTSGAHSTGIIIGSGDTVHFNGTLNGWDIFLEAGASNSPDLSPDYGIDLSSILLVCEVAACENSPLTVTLSDIGFTDVPPALFSSYEAISQTTTGTNSPSIAQTSWWGSTYFSETTQIGSTIGFTGAPIIDQTVTTGGGGPTAPYSLTLRDVFDANSTAGTPDTTFNGTGDIGGAPEPRTMLLFGSGLLAMASVVRRLRRA